MTAQFLKYPIRSDRISLEVCARSRLFHTVSKFQTIEIFDTLSMGRVLTLDGHVQLTELDERIYHGSLVHVPGLNVGQPETALIVGGGDGGVLRELLRYPTIKRVDMVEIDEAVIDACKLHLACVSAGAFDDSRSNVVIADAFTFVKDAASSYDLIVVDSTDIYEGASGSLSEMLFTDEFYGDCYRLLSNRGFVVTQADNPVFCPYSLEAIRNLYQRCFEQAGDYCAVIPSFGGMSAFCWGSKGVRLKTRFSELLKPEFELTYPTQEAYDYGFSDPTRSMSVPRL